MAAITYKIMKKRISDGKDTTEKLMTMADVYYGADRLTEEEYQDIMNTLNKNN